MTKLKKIFSTTLGVKEINDNFSLEDESIDSFKKLLLITNVEKEYNIEIDISIAIQLKTYKDFSDLLIKNKVKEDEI